MPRLSHFFLCKVLSLSVLLFTIVSCDDGLPADPFDSQRDILIVDESSGLTSIDISIARTNFLSLPIADLSNEEVSGIQFIRDEEKAAQDFLQTMDLQYDAPILAQLNSVERTHFESGMLAIQKYGLEDPASGKARGYFTSPNMQAFYNRAIDDGAVDLPSALQAAMRMQEASYVTVFNQLSRVANNRDLRMIYHALATATRNHMRLMDRESSTRGITYAPMFISSSDYADIISGGIEVRSSKD